MCNGKTSSFTIHKLVAKLFLPQTDYTGLTVDHINRKRDDNRVSNLRWVNMAIQSTNKNFAGDCSRPIKQYNLNGDFITEWKSMKDAGKSGLGCCSVIRQICDRNRESFNGHIWRYSDEEYLENEIWKSVSYEDCKEVNVSNKGRVMLNRNKITTGSLSNGYHRVAIKSIQTCKYRHIYVHRLIMAAFKGENSEMVVNHIDGNPSNNNLDNLEYVTQKQNMKHAVNTGLQPKSSKIKAVIVTNNNGYQIKYESCKKAAEEMKVSPSTISTLCNTGHVSKYGFTCRYETVID